MASDKLIKSVFLIHSRPVKGNLTLKARKLVGALARLAGEQYKRLPPEQREQIEDAVRAHVSGLRAGVVAEVPPILFQPRFTARLRQVADYVGHDPSDSRHLMQDLQLLVSTSVELNFLGHTEGHAINEAEVSTYPHEMRVVSTLLSSLVKVGRGTLSWGYDPLVLLVMVHPRTYTYLSLDLNRNARTYTALALYENVRRFLGVKRTGCYPVRRWQQLLSETGEVRTWETVAEFRRKVRRALSELEVVEGCDIKITYHEETRAGEKHVYFEVEPLPQHRLLFGEPVPEDRELARMLRQLGFPETECRGLVEAHGAEYLYAKLDLLKRSRERQHIRDERAWLVAAVRDDWRDQEQEAAKVQEQRDQAQRQRQELENLRKAFDALRAKTVDERLAALPADEQELWKSRYLETDPGQRVAAQFGPESKPFHAAWRHWLVSQAGWLTEDHLNDFTLYVLWAKSQEAVLASTKAKSAEVTRG